MLLKTKAAYKGTPAKKATETNKADNSSVMSSGCRRGEEREEGGERLWELKRKHFKRYG